MDPQRPADAQAPSEAPANDHSPEGLFVYAGRRLAAAGALRDLDSRHLVEALSSLAQALELYSKSYLHFRGLPERQLRLKPYGHDLAYCLEACDRLGLGCPTSASEREALRHLSELHRGKRLHYLYEGSGPTQFPDFETLTAFARRLQVRVFDHISAPYFQAAGAEPETEAQA